MKAYVVGPGGDFQPLGWIDADGLTAHDPGDPPLTVSATHHGTFTATVGRCRGPRMRSPLRPLLGPYVHPRPVLHNGRKP